MNWKRWVRPFTLFAMLATAVFSFENFTSLSTGSQSNHNFDASFPNADIPIASTWDGRVYMGVNYARQADGNDLVSWQAFVFRPEAIAPSASSQPLASSSASPYSSGVLFLTGAEGGASASGSPFVVGCGQDAFNAMTLTPIGQSIDGNPYMSDGCGNPIGEGKCSAPLGNYQTYLFNAIATQYFVPPPADCASNPSAAATPRPLLTQDYLYQFTGYVIVANPKTPNASVFAAGPGSPAKKSQFTPISLQTTSGGEINAIEPSISVDGRFLVMNTTLDSSGVQHGNGHIYFSYNPHGGSIRGWSPPLPIEQAYNFANTNVPTDSGPARFGNLFPIANQPLRQMSGALYPTGSGVNPAPQLTGAYPWLTLDASDVFFQTVQVDTKIALRAGSSVIGVDTGYAHRQMDNWINQDRGATWRTFVFSPGPIPGMWNIMRGIANPPLPLLTAKGPIVPLFSGRSSQYSELSFANASDGHYALFLEMNEFIGFSNPSNSASAAPPMDYFSNITPDSSGNFNNATLVGEAQFPYEQFAGGEYYLCAKSSSPAHSCPGGAEPYQTRSDGSRINAFENMSVSGQAVYLGSSGAVILPDSPTLHFSNAPGFSAELWINPLQSLSGNSLLRKDGSFQLNTLADGALQASVYIGNSSSPTVLSSSPIRATAAVGKTGWFHIAFTYSPLTASLLTYLNGQLVDTVTAPTSGSASPLSLIDSPSPVVIGSGSIPTPLPKPIAAIPWKLAKSQPIPISAIMMVDEVKLSSIVRSQAEIASSAQLQALNPNQSSTQPNLPLGLAEADLVLPSSEHFNPTLIHLGQELFFDARLSVSGNISCSSCHSPSHYLTDSRTISTGVTGIPLPRNAPSLFNRAFSSLQMWDGLAPSLETQVLHPLYGPNEMGSNPSQLSAFINSVPAYSSAFESYFGQQPTPQTVGSMVGAAFASFERSLNSGDSGYDKYQAGSLTSLSANQIAGMQIFFGKGRCVACHSNSNFTDETFHRSILFGNSLNQTSSGSIDPGLADVTGSNFDYGKFKTPSLRNAAGFGHYFHNSSITSLEQVVALYNNGPIEQAGYLADPQLKPLGLSADEQADLVAFLQALISTTPMPLLQAPPLEPISPTAPNQFIQIPGKTKLERSCVLAALSQASANASGELAFASCLLFGHPPSQFVTDVFTADLNAGSASVFNVLNTMFNNPEFNALYGISGMSPSDYVAFIFGLLYYRQPSIVELNAWVAALAEGYTQRDIFNILVLSPEFAQKNPLLAATLPATSNIQQVVVPPSNRVSSRNCYLTTLQQGSASSGNQVNYAYCIILTRMADPGGLAYYTSQLNSGSMSLTQVMNNLFQSSEFSSRFALSTMSSSNLVSFMFSLLYQRSPRPIELNAWLAALAQGYSPVQVFDILISSPNFLKANPVLAAGIPWISNLQQVLLPAGGSVQTRNCFLSAINAGGTGPNNEVIDAYCLLLARNPGPGELKADIGFLQEKQKTLGQIVDALFQSQEFTNLFPSTSVSDTDFIDFVYGLLLFRTPTDSELSSLLNQMASGKISRQQLFDFILALPEFKAKNAPLSGI